MSLNDRSAATTAGPWCAPEADCVAVLLAGDRRSPQQVARARERAAGWVAALRADGARPGGVDALMREFALSSQEGVALMCLAEALARIPDRATADRLLRDKIAPGDWAAHIGTDRPAFVNAAAWGLLISGRLLATHSEGGLRSAAGRALALGGEPLVRAGVALAMRLLGQQFVLGETIESALERARPARERGYRHSFDMLGEAALTAQDAARYLDAYAGAIRAVAAAAAPAADLAERPGISIKLSALHPRFTALQEGRLHGELYPRLLALCRQAADAGLGVNIDAEECERLEPTLALLQRLAREPALAHWEGLGIVVQAYQRRALALVSVLEDMARATHRRLMVRLVKGAYWDSEIKRAQLEVHADYPVFTRKAHTDLSYLVCAARLLQAQGHIYPQFATHNALTVASVLELAAEQGRPAFELQGLHGMGEPLYDHIVPEGLPCRIYAPVGTHETLLAYLVRRLLENGANSSFVHRVQDPGQDLALLLQDPAEAARAAGGQPHPAIVLPAAVRGSRPASPGLNLHDAATRLRLLAALRQRRERETETRTHAPPEPALPVQAPTARASMARGLAWSGADAAIRAGWLEAAAGAIEAQREALVALLVEEGRRTLADSVAEVCEAADFCRYYAQLARALPPGSALAGGPVVAISPWNFPLAIFTGQVACALAAGRAVLAKPAEQTPRVAAQATALLHGAGVPAAALQLIQGDGAVGAELVRQPGIGAALFTGSCAVAASIDRALVETATGPEPAVLVAETGGQNAMIVDASAQAEQVVQDVLHSAFGSAGQRCSALRLLCLQEEIAPQVLAMLKGAMDELVLGDPGEPATDIGPVIDAQARAGIEARLAALPPGALLHRARAPAGGTDPFVAPALVRVQSPADLGEEIFGPVLHVLTFRRAALGRLLADIDATGYALTCGVHSRIDETIAEVCNAVRAGNVYVNRGMTGAVVGVQPFGGQGRSGTGPKAGGPWALTRLLGGPLPEAFHPRAQAFTNRHAQVPARVSAQPPPQAGAMPSAEAEALPPVDPALAALLDHAQQQGDAATVQACQVAARESALGWQLALAGPTGERNTLHYRPRGEVLCLPLAGPGRTEAGLLMAQLACAFAAGNSVWVLADPPLARLLERLPTAVQARLLGNIDLEANEHPAWQRCAAVLVPAEGALARAVRVRLAERPGARAALLVAPYAMDRLVAEQVISVNTAAAGGNAHLMTL